MKMIGQKNLLARFQCLIDRHDMPRFCIIEGPKGSGKVMLAKEVAKMMNVESLIVEPRVADVREMIDLAYKTSAYIAFIIKQADNLTPAAKGAMLKLTEEPPNNAYIFMCVENQNKVSEAIKSRGQTFMMDIYSPEEVYEYARLYWTPTELSSDIANLIIELCNNPGEVDELMSIDALEMYSFVQTVYGHIASSSLENVMKISQKIAMKADSKGYPLDLFFRMFMKLSFKNNFWYMTTTDKYLSQLNSNSSLSKQGLFDQWLFEIRSK